MVDAMSTRKQMLYDSTQDKYVGFVNYGPMPTEKADTLATEAEVFLLVGAQTHWKCPIGYFLADKMSSKTQAKLVQLALVKAAEAAFKYGQSQLMALVSTLACLLNSVVILQHHTTQWLQNSNIPLKPTMSMQFWTQVTCLNLLEMHWATSLPLLTKKKT